MTSKSQVVVIAGPAGSGKNAIIDGIIRRYPAATRLVTATTRPPRPGEKNGVDYYFFAKEKFFEEMENGNILEHRHVESLGTDYGAYKPDLDARIAAGHVVFAHLDIIGARYLKKHYNATTIFIFPDSLESLRERIRLSGRAMSEEELDERMSIAKKEMEEHAPEYDYSVVNRDGRLDEAVSEVVEILEKEGYTLD